MSGGANKTNYIPSLDGIRAVAVALVVVSHAGLDHIVPGGFGVTIFFFLSGYLITTLLRNEWEKTGDISFKDFYLRRIYRIFPPLYLVLGIVVLLTWLGVVGEGKSFGIPSLLAQLFFATNYYAIVNGEGLFLPGTAVLWSLAIEEHFYFVFPVLMLFLVKRKSYRQVATIFVGICVLVLLWRIVLVYLLSLDEIYTYMASDARADSLLWGCFSVWYLIRIWTLKSPWAAGLRLLHFPSPCRCLCSVCYIETRISEKHCGIPCKASR